MTIWNIIHHTYKIIRFKVKGLEVFERFCSSQSYSQLMSWLFPTNSFGKAYHQMQCINQPPGLLWKPINQNWLVQSNQSQAKNNEVKQSRTKKLISWHYSKVVSWSFWEKSHAVYDAYLALFQMTCCLCLLMPSCFCHWCWLQYAYNYHEFGK